MRFARSLAGTLLLTIGLPAVLIGPGLAAGLRPTLPVHVSGPLGWSLLAAGAVLVGLGVAVLTWPRPPREVVFVVPPGEVPLLAARLGVTGPEPTARPGAPSLEPAPSGSGRDTGAGRLRPVPGLGGRPESLADLAPVRPAARSTQGPGIGWPPDRPAPVTLAMVRRTPVTLALTGPTRDDCGT